MTYPSSLSLRRGIAGLALGAAALAVGPATASPEAVPATERGAAETPFSAPLPDRRPSGRAYVEGVYLRKSGVTPLHRDAKLRFEAARQLCPKLHGRPARLISGRIEDAGTFYGYEYLGPKYAEYLYIHELTPLDPKACELRVRLKKIVTLMSKVGGRWEIATYAQNDNQPGDVNERIEDVLLDEFNAGYLPARRKYAAAWVARLQPTGKEEQPFPFVRCRVVLIPSGITPAWLNQGCITDSTELPPYARPMVLRALSRSPDNPAHKFEVKADKLVPSARIDVAVFDLPKDLPLKEKRYVERP